MLVISWNRRIYSESVIPEQFPIAISYVLPSHAAVCMYVYLLPIFYEKLFAKHFCGVWKPTLSCSGLVAYAKSDLDESSGDAFSLRVNWESRCSNTVIPWLWTSAVSR